MPRPAVDATRPDSGRPTWICVTPTRNERWIIGHFVAAAQTWADEVIVADQLSDDGTREYLERQPGVTTVRNDSPEFDEEHRQRLLLERARRVPGKRILLGLDADEALSANCRESREWELIERAAPSTILRFRWVNVLPQFHRAWIPPGTSAFGFVDDGSEHNGRRMHSPRVPQPPGAPVLELQDIVVLHFQYVLWDRMLSKQRWYQVIEHIKHRDKGALDIFREYHHMLGSWEAEEIQPMRAEWLDSYLSRGIDFRSLQAEPVTWWDKDILRMLTEHGPEAFRRIDIWQHDWTASASAVGVPGRFDDPRSPLDKAAHALLAKTQHRRHAWSTRVLEKALRSAGW